MHILELKPGGGWWTEILAPYAARTGGRYYTTGPDPDNPELPDRLRAARARFEERFGDTKVYGEVTVLDFGATSAPLPESSFDFILSARAGRLGRRAAVHRQRLCERSLRDRRR